MIKIRVSYQNKAELDQLVSLIGVSNIKHLKLSNNREGAYKKAYITMKEV